jgi:Tfp pilus assembly protein PilO
MSRTVVLLSVLAGILLVALSWFLLFQPKNQEIVDLQAETESLEVQAQQLQLRVATLQRVREASPDFEAELAAAYAVIPREPALPAMLRQFQSAADESGVTLMAVTPARPADVGLEVGVPDLARISVSVDVEGSYFQMVDFLRRLEDPAISPRALGWNGVSITSDPEEYPRLAASLQGDLYALVPAPTAPEDDVAGEDTEPAPGTDGELEDEEAQA